MRPTLLALASILCVACCAGANESRVGDVVIERPWARSSAGRTATGVVYLRIVNVGSESERLISVATPVAAEAAVHETTREHALMSMRPLRSVELAANEVVSLEPGGLHIMLMRLRSPLVEGETFPMTLTFERTGTVAIRVRVRGAGAMGPHE